MAADMVRYLVFTGGALAVLQESNRGVTPKRLATAVFIAAVVLPSGVLLVSGVESDVALGVSLARAAVYPTVAVLGFQKAYRVVTKESIDVSGVNSQRALVRRVTGAFLKCQWMYERLTGKSPAVSDGNVCHAIARRILATTGIGAVLVGGVWLAETLRREWEYFPSLAEKLVVIVGEFVQIGAGVVTTTLVLTALVLVALWLIVRPVVVSRVVFAVGAFSVACGVLNLPTLYVIPAPVEVTVGRVVKWSLVARQPGWTVIWLLDMLNVQEAVALVGFAYGTQVVRRTASGSASARGGSLRE
jgi:hypothetical protein